MRVRRVVSPPRLCKSRFPHPHPSPHFPPISLISPSQVASNLPNHFVAASHTLVLLGHPSLSFVPHLHSFPGTAGDVPSIPAGCSGAGPGALNPHIGSRAPCRDFGTGARTELGSARRRSLSLPFPEVTSRFTNFVTGLLAGSLSGGGSSSGQERPAIPAHESRPADPRVAGGLCATPSDAPLQWSLPRRQQLQQRQLLASRPWLGLLPSSSCSISGQKGKPYSSLQQVLFPVRKTGGLETH